MNERIINFLYKLVSDTELEEIEKKELDHWLAQSSHNRSLFDEIVNREILEEDVREILLYKIKDLPARIVQLNERKIVRMENSKYKWWYAAIAVLFIMLTVGAYYVFIRETNYEIAAAKPEEKRIKTDAVPGHDGAILKLADDRTIILDSAANGTLTTEGNTKIEKIGNGQLVYQATAKEPQKVLYNILYTPRGRKFRLTLPDGSNVWLNAESSITFPLGFVGKERKVQISGEAYFEVKHNQEMPFIVVVPSSQAGGNDLEVKVLGTHFNVMAYPDEHSINTTLLEGSIQVKKGSETSSLKPGQQAQLNDQGVLKLINNVNMEGAIAWKNDLFNFDRVDIRTIMRQVSRWYDLEINYEKEISQTFTGTIPRTVNASMLFNYLELTRHVHFILEGKRVTVKE